MIPNDLGYIIAVNGALLELTRVYRWEKFGLADSLEAAALMSDLFQEYLESDACMIGAILPYATLVPPPGCLPCDGSQFDRADYPRLYDRLAAVLIVDSDHFRTPDLRNLAVLGAGDLYAAGDVGGESEVTLTVNEMPAHSHTTQPHTHGEGIAVPALINGGLEAPASAATPSAGTTGPASVTVDSTGGDGAHNNLPPFQAWPYCIVAR